MASWGSQGNDNLSTIKRPGFEITAKPNKQTQTTTQESTVAEAVSNLINTDYVPAKSIIVHIEGQGWVVNYYSQILFDGASTNSQEVGSSNVNQQYKLIKDFELKVDQPLEESERESGVMTFTGSSVVLPSLVPNKGDMFVAGVSDGRYGVFEVYETERLSVYLDTTYRIGYQMVAYLDDDRTQDFKNKTVETVYFDKERLARNEDPFLTEQEHQNQHVAKETYANFVQKYHREFFSDEHVTLILQEGDTDIYDSYITKFFNTIVTSNMIPANKKPTELNLGGDLSSNIVTVLDAFLQRDISMVNFASQNLRLVSTGDFSIQTYTSSIALSGIEKTMYPYLEQTHLEKVRRVTDHTLHTALQTAMANDSTDDLAADAKYYPVDYDSGYILSMHFYNGTEDKMSPFELAVYKHLKGEKFDVLTIWDTIEQLNSGTPKDRFFLGPLVFAMVRLVDTTINM